MSSSRKPNNGKKKTDGKRFVSLLNPPLTPKNGVELNVFGVCRISGKNQDEKSLDDQENLYEE
ncbi:MAG: hypothetical protein ACKV2Q_28420 [Planctomycetaceae bacterium]